MTQVDMLITTSCQPLSDLQEGAETLSASTHITVTAVPQL